MLLLTNYEGRTRKGKGGGGGGCGRVDAIPPNPPSITSFFLHFLNDCLLYGVETFGSCPFTLWRKFEMSSYVCHF